MVNELLGIQYNIAKGKCNRQESSKPCVLYQRKQP